VVGAVMLGITLNETKGARRFMLRIKKDISIILPTLQLIVFFIAAFSESGGKQFNFKEDGIVFLPALCLNISVMLLGYLYARKTKVNHRGAYTIAIEMGLQNSALAIFIANNIMHEQKMAIVALVYGSFTFISTFI